MAQFFTFISGEFIGNRLIILSLIGILLSIMPVQGQSKVVFSENFDNATSLQPWAPYYSTGWINKNTNTLQSVSGKGKVFHVNFASGTIGVDHGLGNYRIPLDSAYKELYLSWEYFVPSNFDFGFGDGIGGGKFFGGFSGGSMTAIPNTDATDVDGWVSIFMFQNGYYSTYNYFKGSSFSSGGWPLGTKVANITKGQWKRITIRMKVNDGDQSNGIYEVFDNDVLVYQLPNTKIVNSAHPEYLIEHIYLNSFFGGTGTQYVSPINQYMEFDNIVAFYYPKGSAGYRSGASESGRKIDVPVATSYHPVPPNKFTPTNYTQASGTISSHCGYYQPADNIETSQTSTIQVAGATSLNINVTKFICDQGVNYIGYKQILKIYQGTGTSKVLKKTLQNGISTALGSVSISGNSATIEWQAGQGSHNGFTLTYSSNGTGSGKNFACSSCTAEQSGGSSSTPVAIPHAPSALTYSDLTDRSVTLKWTDNCNNETSFEIERKSPDGTTQILTSNANVTSCSSTGLIGNTRYSYRVRSTNSAGASAFSNTVEVTTNYALPNVPSNLAIAAKTSSSVSLSWTDNSGIEDGFKIERSLSSSSGFSEVGTTGANVTAYTNNTCSSGTTYYYRVRAYNPAGNTAYTPVISVTTTGTATPPVGGVPAAPSSLVSTSQSNSTISLRWSDNSTNEAGFNIERSLSPTTGFTVMGKVGANVTTYTNTTLRSGATYYYRVCAYNSSGNSLYTAVLGAKTRTSSKSADGTDTLSTENDNINSVMSKISVYPNPSSGRVNLLISIGNNLPGATGYEQLELKVVSITGSTVFSKFVSVTPDSEQQESLDLSELPGGLYFLILQRGDQLIKEKLVISK